LRTKPRTLFQLLVLLSICYFLFFFRMGARDLWNPDEPRYAQVAREMIETGEWVVPHLNGEVYPEKPPLYFWLVALLSKPAGDVTEVTARLPSAMSATLIVLLTYLLGSKMLGGREAFAGAVIMATSAQFFWLGRDGVIDLLLTLFILAALSAFYIGHVEKLPLLYVAGFVFLAPAALSKGPVGIAVPVVVMLAFLLLEILLRKEGGTRQLGWFALAMVIGLAIVGLFVVPWWRAAYERSGGAYGSLSILVKQTQGRMLESYSHRRPFHYYFGEILWQFLPWIVFFPLAAHTVRKKGNIGENRGLRFLVVWFLSVFLFFTLISGKRSQYLAPLLPAGGLILGWALTNANPDEGRLRERRAFSIPLLLLLLLSVVGLVVIEVGAYRYAREYIWFASAGVLAPAIALAVLYRQCLDRPPRVALAWVAAATILTVAVVFGVVNPVADAYKSAQPKPNVHYYMHRRMPQFKSNEEVKEAIEHLPRVFLVEEWERRSLLDLCPAYEVEHVTRAQIGSRDVLCVMVREAANAPPAG
jgi:4-amino-4-deoxy-L-arabinose transferase-like glycosyltransferase